jgi:hypothetical protein
MGTGIHSRGYSGRSMKVSSHIHLVPKLSVNGATPLLPPYAFMAWTGTPLHLPLYICITGINLAAVKCLKGVLNSVTFLDLFQHKWTLRTPLFWVITLRVVVEVVLTV